MKKADKNKLLYLMSISLILFIAGCVDTNVTNIPESIDYRAEVNVVNLVAGANSAAIQMDIASGGTTDLGSLNIGSAWPSDNSYQNIPAGSKTFNIKYSSGKSDQLKTTTESNTKMRLFIVGDTAASSQRAVVKYTKGYTFDTSNAVSSGETQFAFFNGSPNDTLSNNANLTTAGYIVGKDTSYVTYPDFSTRSPYKKVKPGTYTFFVTSSSGTVYKKSVNLESRKSYTVIDFGYMNGLKLNVLTDD